MTNACWLVLFVQQIQTLNIHCFVFFVFFKPVSLLLFIFRFVVGDLSDSEGDLSSEPLMKEEEFQGTEETHRAFSHGTELIPW